MKRIFIAVKINPEAELLNMISVFRTGLIGERVKWTEPVNFHITLAFLGNTTEDKIKDVAEMLREVCSLTAHFEIIIKGAGLFKNKKDPRVIWTGIEPSEELIQLQKSVNSGLKDDNILVEDRPFNPHLTMGRIKSIRDYSALESIVSRYEKVILQKQKVDEVILYESILINPGPVYKPLQRFPLI